MPHRRRLLTACIAAVVMAGPAMAYAFPTSRLIYQRGAGAERCPDERAVRSAVADRLGYDPFVGSATRTIIARVLRVADRLEAHIELVNQFGARQGSREFSTEPKRCDELISAMALSISIAIDAQRARATQHSAAVSAATPGTLDSGPEWPNDDERRTPLIRWYSGAGGHAAFGSLPAATGGAFAFGGVSFDLVSLSLEGRIDAPASATRGNAKVSASVALLSIVPCLHGARLFVCSLVSAGALRATASGISAPRSDSGLYAAAGLRAGAALPLYEPLSLRLHVDLLKTLTRVTLEIDERDVWKAPAVSSAGGLGLMAQFP